MLNKDDFEVIDSYIDSEGYIVYQIAVNKETDDLLKKFYKTENYDDIISKEFETYIKELDKNDL